MAASMCKGPPYHFLVVRSFPLLCALTGATRTQEALQPDSGIDLRIGEPCQPGADQCPAPLYCISKTGRASESKCGTCAAATSEETKPLPQLIGMEWETNFDVTCDVPGDPFFVMCRAQAVMDTSKGLYDAFLVANKRVGPYARAPLLAVTQDLGRGHLKTMELIGGPMPANKEQQTVVAQLATLVLRAVDALEPCYTLERSSKDYCTDKRNPSEKEKAAKAVRISQVRSWVNREIKMRKLDLPDMVYPEGCMSAESNKCEEAVLISFPEEKGTTSRQANVAISLNAYSKHHSEILASMPDKADKCRNDFCRRFLRWASANHIYRRLSEQVGNILGMPPFQFSIAVAKDHDVRGFFIYLLTYFTTLWLKEQPSAVMDPYVWGSQHHPGHLASDDLKEILFKSQSSLDQLFGKRKDHDRRISEVKNFWQLLPKAPLDACLRAIAARDARTELRKWWGTDKTPFKVLSSFMCDGLIDVLFTDDVLPEDADETSIFRMWLKGLCKNHFKESQEGTAIYKLRRIFDQDSERYEGETDQTYGYGYTRAEVNRILTIGVQDDDPATAALKPIPFFKMKTALGGSTLGMVLETRSSSAPWSNTLAVVRCASSPSSDDEALGRDFSKDGCENMGGARTTNGSKMAFYFDSNALASQLTAISILASK